MPYLGKGGQVKLYIEKRLVEIAILDTVDIHRVVEIYHPEVMGGPCPLVCIEESDGIPTICWGVADVPLDAETTRLFAEALLKATEIATNWESVWMVEKVHGG